MQVGYFTERPYRWLPEEEILKNRAFFPEAEKPLKSLRNLEIQGGLDRQTPKSPICPYFLWLFRPFRPSVLTVAARW
jgi:hypothetical protein